MSPDTPRTNAQVAKMIRDNQDPEGLEFFARQLERELKHAADNYDRLMAAARKMWVAFARRAVREAHKDAPDAMIELIRAWRELGEIVNR